LVAAVLVIGGLADLHPDAQVAALKALSKATGTGANPDAAAE